MSKISSGSKIIDNLLKGGFERGVISTIYGAAGTGKSNILMQCCLNVAKQAKKVIFVDTEGGFSAERASQLNNKYKDLMKHVIMYNPTSFEEQRKVFEEIKEVVKVEKVGLILIDSIAMLYRLNLGDSEIAQETNREMANQLSLLSEIARKIDVAVVVTNQVYADFKTKDVKMVGGDLLKYWSKCIVKLDHVESTGIRKAVIIKHRSLPMGLRAFFDIKDSGLQPARDPKKRFGFFSR
jgi:DNA repair protein RadB